MKKSGIVLMLGVSVVTALGASALAMSWLEERTAVRDPQNGQSAVVVAATRIPFGETVRMEDLRMVSLPREAIPSNSFSNRDEVVGRVAAQTLYPGETVLSERVVENLGGSALGAVLANGKRAISVRVDDVAGVAGFILPNNRVDVLATRRAGNGRNMETETILRDINVLAVDQRASPEGEDGPMLVRAVTLEVSPDEAERVTKAAGEGKIQLTLRNPTDRAFAALEEPAEKEDEPTVVAEKPKVKPSTNPVPPRLKHVNVTIVRGVEASSERVHDHGPAKPMSGRHADAESALGANDDQREQQ